MAKGKHSAALFEVIKHQSSRPEKVEPIAKPRNWWFGGGRSTEAPRAAEPSHVVADRDESPLVMPRAAATHTSPRHDASRSSGIHLDFDRDRKEITLRLRYTTAIVTTFGICALIGSAYVIGGHLGHGPQVASGKTQPTIQELLKQPPQAGVIVLNHPKPQRPAVVETPKPAPAEPVAANVEEPRSIAAVSLIPATAETRLPRTIGLNYIIVQTYPPEEQQTAEAARDFLTSNGIPCTLEVTDYVRNPHWLCLVGTAGFTKISSQDCRSYVESIVKLGEKFPSSRFDRFRPAAYKWKG